MAFKVKKNVRDCPVCGSRLFKFDNALRCTSCGAIVEEED